MKEKRCLGWREYVALPRFGVKAIKVKVDSGARTSALHAEDLKIVHRGGKTKVHFKIYPKQRSKKVAIDAVADVIDSRVIRSSVGHETIRPVIRTNVEIGGDTFEIEVTLVNRDIMGFRMLLGREAIRRRFLVDPGRSYLMGNKNSKKGRK